MKPQTYRVPLRAEAITPAMGVALIHPDDIPTRKIPLAELEEKLWQAESEAAAESLDGRSPRTTRTTTAVPSSEVRAAPTTEEISILDIDLVPVDEPFEIVVSETTAELKA